MEAHYPPRPGKSGSRQPESADYLPRSTALNKNVTLVRWPAPMCLSHFAPSGKTGSIPDNSDEGRIVYYDAGGCATSGAGQRAGVSAAELGYAVRPVRPENEQSVPAVQLYDIISGGAGFTQCAIIAY
ncbi:hypothetical protein KCP78_23130 [Salmonella enterica subsp. enterica]|nr:hypothetical protein KCP78_23130 [Salmonella enterica subsp. enterica]